MVDLQLADLSSQQVDRLEVVFFLPLQQLFEVSPQVQVLAAALDQLLSILITARYLADSMWISSVFSTDLS